ncbi:MAG: lycopene cyclase domain-containing protein [Bacteroidetes bacterium]|nr:lycopene cyclase domain-containing protein [Bacteroidota bacterium]
MKAYTYLALMIVTLLPFVLKFRDANLPLRRNVRNALGATAIVAVPFLVWDVIVTAAGHWSFSDTYTTGIRIINLPLEEVLFFIAVPLAAVLVWDTVGFFLKR